MRRAWIHGVIAMLLSAGLAAWAASPTGVPGGPSAAVPTVEARFGPEADYGPFVYATADGRVEGLSVEMLELVARRAGLAVRTLPAQPLQQWLALARRGQVDLLSSLRPTPERAVFLLFSRPYVQIPAMLIVRTDQPLARDNSADTFAALAGRRVAVGAGYAVESFVRRAHPAVQWQAVSDDVTALRGVAQRQFDAAVVDAASAAFVVRHHRIDGLRAVGPVGFDYALSFAVRKDWPELLARVDAALAAIPASERAAVVARWMPPLESAAAGLRAPARPVAGLAIALVALGLFIAGVGWRRQVAASRRGRA